MGLGNTGKVMGKRKNKKQHERNVEIMETTLNKIVILMSLTSV